MHNMRSVPSDISLSAPEVQFCYFQNFSIVSRVYIYIGNFVECNTLSSTKLLYVFPPKIEVVLH